MPVTTVWQQLGAFVVSGENLTEDRIAHFADVGGRWLVPVIYNDFSTGPWNLEHLAELKATCAKHNVRVGGWFNCFGGDPQEDARNIAAIASAHGLTLIIIDAEAAYQYPGGNPNLLPLLAKAVRTLLPHADIAISTNGLNSSGIWNGRTLSPPQSMYDLGIRVLPQWYTWMYQANGAERPDNNMAWLKAHGGSDGNFRDANAAKTSYRGVPLSYVHGTVEVTGVEGSDLADELHWLVVATAHGLTPGFSLYALDNAPDLEADLELIRPTRGTLFLV